MKSSILFNVLGSLVLLGSFASAAPIADSVGQSGNMQARQLSYDENGTIIATPPLPYAADAEASKAAIEYATNENKKAMAAKANVQKRQKYDKGGNVIQLPPVDTSDPEALAAAKKYLQDQLEQAD